MTGFREFLRSSSGKYLGGALLALGLAAALYSIWSVTGDSDAAALSRGRWFVDSVTHKGFRHELSLNESIPVLAPSGGKTGYPAELCYWNKDGSPKSPGQDPTPVLLNATLGKPDPTFCPECGRLVVGHNPVPAQTNNKPPPTKAEFDARASANPAR